MAAISLHEISYGNKIAIQEALKKSNFSQAAKDAFMAVLAESISRFKANACLAEQSRPSAVNERLSQAVAAAKALTTQMNKFDGNCKNLIGEAHMGGFPDLLQQISSITVALSRAKKLAFQYPGQSSGRLREPHRLWLAVDVADAISVHLNETPTSTKNGFYVEVLESVLHEALDREPKQVAELARRALKKRDLVKRTQPDGAVEYLPEPI